MQKNHTDERTLEYDSYESRKRKKGKWKNMLKYTATS